MTLWQINEGDYQEQSCNVQPSPFQTN